MTDTTAQPRSSSLRANENCPRDKEINILLLGQTGVGKTTFINSFVNYLVNDTFDDAIDGQTPVIIPTSFSFTDPNTFEESQLFLGERKKEERGSENGQTGTQHCRSYIFPIGDRNLRLIDTPGMGDTRGTEQDNKNLFEILTFTSYYEHLNGICIFLKPNEERLTISFRLYIKQILHDLNVSACENLVFIFSNARSTFFTPGSSKKLLQVLLNDYQTEHNLQIPFSKANTFLFDNETVRYIALRKHRIHIDEAQTRNYRTSWESSGREYERLLTYISGRSLFAVRETLSINEAKQLIRKFPRPIAETIRLIQQNIERKGLPFQVAQIVQFAHPRLVCISKKCLLANESNAEQQSDHYRVCKEKSRLNGVAQEAINDTRISQCKTIDIQSGNCIKCDCSWERHMHMTYEYRPTLKNSNDPSIRELEKEQEMIMESYGKLSKFLYHNAIHPLHDDFLQYLQLFIGEERLKDGADTQNQQLIDNLIRIKEHYESEIDVFKSTSADSKDSNDQTAADVFSLVGALYRLPIHGRSIREQIDRLKIAEENAVRRVEKYVELPIKANSTQNMCKFRDIFSSQLSTVL